MTRISPARIQHIPRADRVRIAEATANSRSPDLVRFGDELRMRDGTFKVCRLAVEGERLLYVCTNGATTRVISADEVGASEHYRDGLAVNKRRMYRDAL